MDKEKVVVPEVRGRARSAEAEGGELRGVSDNFVGCKRILTCCAD